MKSKIINWLVLVYLFLFQGIVQAEKNPNNQTPNIVLIYLDDMGYGDISLTGAVGYRTPNIDRLAIEGMLFTHFYAPQAVCTASRAGLLTGCYPNRIGMTGAINHNSEIGINYDEVTIAEMLKKRGYNTAIFGKWHLGCQPQFLPLRHGFDEFYGIPYSNDMGPNHPRNKTYPPLPLIEGENVVSINPDQTEFTTQFTNRTIKFIKKNRNNPFFVYLAHPMPHVPLHVSDKFKGKSEQGMFGDVMMEIDWSIEQILKTLKELKLEKKTLIIFTSDNGPWLNYGNYAGSSGGFREGKGTTFEGGQRLPCLMMWKGVIPSGTICNNIASGIDILPTIAAITDAPLPEHKIDGINLLPLLKGNFEANPRNTFYFYYRKNSLEAVRKGQWKLVFNHSGRTYTKHNPGNNGTPGLVDGDFVFEGGLYNLRRDPGERYDVQDLYPEIKEDLEKLAEKARNDLGDDLTGKLGANRREPGKVQQK